MLAQCALCGRHVCGWQAQSGDVPCDQLGLGSEVEHCAVEAITAVVGKHDSVLPCLGHIFIIALGTVQLHQAQGGNLFLESGILIHAL